MTVHILNSLVIHPYLTPIIGGITCLLVETNRGPVLVDAGIGTRDQLEPAPRMGWYLRLYRASRGLERTAFNLVQKLSYRPQDVHHIIVSHLHLDHAGGLSDFPWAHVHVYKGEYDQILTRPNWRNLPGQWAHAPIWALHEKSGEKWLGLDAIQLKEFEPEIWLLPLPGHTPGHAGIAIRNGDGWILYGGDALPYNARIDLVPRWFARCCMYHHAPHLRGLIREYPEVRLVAGHMSLGYYENE